MRLRTSHRSALAAGLLALLVLSAGCSALGGSAPAGPSANETTTTTANATTTTDATTSSTTSTSTDATNAASDGADDENASDGHSHSHGDADASNETPDAALTGTMTLVVGDGRVALEGGETDTIAFAEDAGTWASDDESLTLADALGTQDVNATPTALSYDGTTYDGSENGTTVAYRVNGEAVDPTEATLSDGDSVWVYVSTPDTEIQPPGTYLPEATDHEHGPISVVVDGEPVNLSQERFQEQNRYFHLEGGNGERWHAHTWSATYGWALSTLGIDVSADSVTYDNETYVDGENATVRVLVNGERVDDPGSYRLKDGDAVRVVVESND